MLYYVFLCEAMGSHGWLLSREYDVVTASIANSPLVAQSTMIPDCCKP